MGKAWIYFENRQRPIHDISKFTFAFVMIAFMYAFFYLALFIFPGSMLIPGWIIITGLFFMAVSELSLSAIGLSMVTKVAPPGFVSLYMGIWLVTIGIGGKLAGAFSGTIMINQDIIQSKLNMGHGFLIFIGIALFSMILCFAVKKPLMRFSKQLS